MRYLLCLAVISAFLVFYSHAMSQGVKPEGTSCFSSHAFVLDGRMISSTPLTIQEIDFLLFAPEPIYVNGKVLQKRSHDIDGFLRNPTRLKDKLLACVTGLRIQQSRFGDASSDPRWSTSAPDVSSIFLEERNGKGQVGRNATISDKKVISDLLHRLQDAKFIGMTSEINASPPWIFCSLNVGDSRGIPREGGLALWVREDDIVSMSSWSDSSDHRYQYKAIGLSKWLKAWLLK